MFRKKKKTQIKRTGLFPLTNLIIAKNEKKYFGINLHLFLWIYKEWGFWIIQLISRITFWSHMHCVMKSSKRVQESSAKFF